MKNWRNWLLAAVVFAVMAITPTAAGADDEQAWPTVDLTFDCDNYDSATEAHEPIINIWTYTDDGWQGGDIPWTPYGAPGFYFAVESPRGVPFGAYEGTAFPSSPWHDSWPIGYGAVPLDQEIWVGLYFNDVLHYEVTAWCPSPVAVEPPVHVDPAPRKQPAPSPVPVPRSVLTIVRFI